MASSRRTAAVYGLPVATLVLALVLQTGASAQHAAVPVRLVLSLLAIGLVFATVFVTLHHAEAIAHRIGEPYGTLVLTFAVTTIEVTVIVSMMLHGDNNPTLARESVFSTVMIVCGGVIGLCLTLGGLRHRHQELKRQGTNAYLSMLTALAVLTLILPDFTRSAGHGAYSPAQLAFVSVLSLLLYGSFVYAQMGSHKQDFVEELVRVEEGSRMAAKGNIGLNVLLLLVGLAGVVLLAEDIAAGVETGLEAMQVSQADAIVGAFIAILVLTPESLAAIRASLRNELQRSLNIALGSACATIGLTIPAVAIASLVTGRELTLGLTPGDTVLLLLGLGISIISFGTGRTTVLTGLVHLVVFGAYLFLTFIP
ncbi:MAG: ionic transporter [Pseudomonadota bacterium]|nr:ionic transporter [Pseudomonadota bacterium]